MAAQRDDAGALGFVAVRTLAAAGAVVAALTCAACGGQHAKAVARPGWRASAATALRQLQSDVAAAEVGGTTKASAAHALRSFSDLYALSFAFADLAGCRSMVAVADPPRNVASLLERPCAHLERAAALFTRAVSKSQPAALVRATQEVQRAEPSLVRALATLRPA